MKIFNVSVLIALTNLACQESAPTITHPPQEPDQAFEAVLRGLEKNDDAAEAAPSQPEPQAEEQRLQGTPAVVLEHRDVERYTYAKVRTPEDTFWVAGPQTAFEVGQPVRLYGGNWMYNFESKALGQKFDRIMFVSRYLTPRKLSSDTAPTEGEAPAQAPADNPEFGNEPTIAATLEAMPEDGTKGSFKGEVTKVNAGILGKTWIHIRDYSAAAPKDDLICTLPSQYVPKVGDQIVVEGAIKRNVDLGSGYAYEILLEATGYAALTTP